MELIISDGKMLFPHARSWIEFRSAHESFLAVEQTNSNRQLAHKTRSMIGFGSRDFVSNRPNGFNVLPIQISQLKRKKSKTIPTILHKPPSPLQSTWNSFLSRLRFIFFESPLA